MGWDVQLCAREFRNLLHWNVCSVFKSLLPFLAVTMESNWGKIWNPLFLPWSHALWDISNHFVLLNSQLLCHQDNVWLHGMANSFGVIMYSAVSQIEIMWIGSLGPHMFWGTRATNFSIYTTKMGGARLHIVRHWGQIQTGTMPKKLLCKPGLSYALCCCVVL